MTASVRILSTSSVDSSPSILFVSPDGSKILLNCGEGCQRTFLEYSQRLATVKAVCLTHLGHESIGGLPGMILTSADAAASAIAEKTVVAAASINGQHKNGKKIDSDNNGKQDFLPGLDILGPKGTKHFIHSLRHFMRRDKFRIMIQEGATGKFCATAPPKRKQSKKNKDADESGFFTVESLAFKHFIDAPQGYFQERKRPHPDSENERQSSSQNNNQLERQVLSFIVKTPPIQGKFLVEKAMELGIPKGKLYGELKSGKSVSFTDKDGIEKTVESHQVVTPTSPAVAVMILYYPSSQVANQIFSSEQFHATTYLKGKAQLELVIHITTNELFEKYGCSYWLEKDQDSSVEHIFLTTNRITGDLDGTPFQYAAAGATVRSLLHKDIYPTPKLAASRLTETVICTQQKYKVGRTQLEYTLIPLSKKGFQPLEPLKNEEDDEKTLKFLEESGVLKLSREVLERYESKSNGVMHSKGELRFTGTGSALPCRHRNVTGILMKQADGRSILLDVGEGTIGQLYRSQPEACKDDILNNIKAVWISHPHADHHLGIVRLLHDRKAPDPVMLIAPTPIFRFLEEYSELEPSVRAGYYAIDCRHLVNFNHELRDRLQRTLGIENCRAVPVQHCPHSYACVLDGTSFGRLVYSGDCRPSNHLVDAAKGADLLIHEATFEDGMEAEAALKRHSTVGEALDVGYRMETKCTILTHFSQRYPKIQPIPSQRKGDFPVIFAFDYMKVQPSTLHIAAELTPALRLLYPEVDESDKSNLSIAETAMAIPGMFAHSALL